MAYEVERNLLDESQAIRISQTSNPLTTDKELVRLFNRVRRDQLATSLTFLNTYCSVKNFPTVSSTIVNPKADGVEYPGTWRIVSNDAAREAMPDLNQEGIIQTLRLGFIQSINVDASKWTEARLGAGVLQQQSGNTQGNQEHYITAVFKNVDPTKLKTISNTLNVTTFTNPVIKGETYTGTWNNLIVRTKVETDGSGTVEIVMGDPQYQLESFDDYGTINQGTITYLWNVPKDLAQGILTAWKALGAEGSTATAAYNQSASLVDLVYRTRADATSITKEDIPIEWNCRYKTIASYYWGITEAEADALQITEPPDGQTWTYSISQDKTDGTWNVVITKRLRQVQDVASYTSEVGYDGVTTTQQKLGTTDSSALPVSSQSDGVIQVRKVDKNEDCSNDISLSTKTDTYKHVETYNSRQGKGEYATVEEHLRHTNESISLPDMSDSEQGVETTINKKRNQSGSEDIRVDRRIVKNYSNIATYETNDSTKQKVTAYESIGVRNTGSTVLSLNPTAGQRLSAQVRYDKSTDTLDIVQVVDYAKSVTNTRKTYAPSFTETIEEVISSATQLSDESSETGKIKTIENEISDYAGRYNTKKTTREPQDQTSESYVEDFSKSEKVTTHTENASQLVAPSEEMGKIKENTSIPTDAGNYKTTERVVEPKNQDKTSYIVSPASETETRLQTEVEAEPAKPEAEDGKIKIVNVIAKPSGKNQIEEQTKEVKDQTVTSYEDNALTSVTTTEHSAATTALTVPTAEEGTVVERINRITEHGKPNTVERIMTGKTVVIPETPTEYSDTVTETTEIHFNDTVPVITDTADLEVSIRDWRYNEFQKHDYRVVKRTPRVPSSFGSLGDVKTWSTYGNYYWVYEYEYDPFDQVDYIQYAYKIQKRYVHALTYVKTASNAATFINATVDFTTKDHRMPEDVIMPLIARDGSGISPVSSYLWSAHKIVRNDVVRVIKYYSSPFSGSVEWTTYENYE